MKMLQAIAESVGNKARTKNNDGLVVIVQERYTAQLLWYHVWLINENGEIIEDNLPVEDFPWIQRLRERYLVDTLANYWHAV